jgi:hypothetical protein
VLFYWIRGLLKKIAWLFKLPQELDVARVNPDLKCPVCGAEDGRLRCVEQLVTNGTAILCEHTCNVCAARFYEKPVAKVNPSLVAHAVPRNQLEKDADAEFSRGPILQYRAKGGVQ